MEDVKKALKDFVVANYLYGEGDVGDDQALFDSGVIDSFGFVRLIGFIEEKFGVTFDRSELVIDKFNTINNIVASIEKKK